MSTPDGGPAFPFHRVYESGNARESDGLSLRDYFAAHALNSRVHVGTRDFLTEEAAAKEIARLAYLLADAMLKVRSA